MADPGIECPSKRPVFRDKPGGLKVKMHLVAIASSLMALFHTAGAVWRW
jgi:hypothetical protein